MEDYSKNGGGGGGGGCCTKLIRVLSVMLKNKHKQKLKQDCSLYRIFMAERCFWRRDDAHNYSNFLHLTEFNKMRQRTRRNSGMCKRDLNNLDIQAHRTIANALPNCLTEI